MRQTAPALLSIALLHHLPDHLRICADQFREAVMVAAQAINRIYPLIYKYTIVTATGGITGKYGGLTTNLAFLRPTITYDVNNVYLEASVNTPTVDYSCGATTANQNAVATALNQADNVATGDFPNVIGALFGLNNHQGSAALDAMSGQPCSGFGTANIFSGNLFGSAPRQQMVLSLQLRAGQAHDYANMTRPVKAAFAAAPGASFTIFGPAPPRDSATVGLRLWTMLDAGYMPFLRYDGDIARGADSHGINAGVRMNW